MQTMRTQLEGNVQQNSITIVKAGTNMTASELSSEFNLDDVSKAPGVEQPVAANRRLTFAAAAAAMVVYLLAIPVILLLLILIFLVSLFALCAFPIGRLCRGPKFSFVRSPDALKVAEEAALADVIKLSKHEHLDVPISVRVGEKQHDLTVHSILGYQEADGRGRHDKPLVLVVHGTAGSSMSAIKILDLLSHDFTLHFIDLPVFGRSEAPRDFLALTNSQVIDFYVDVLRQYITKQCSSHVCVVAHSFGGFLCTALASRHPELITKLILVNPAGMFSTLGSKGAYWAIFFKLAKPQAVFRMMGPLATFIMHTFMEYKRAPLAADYDFQLLASPSAFGDLFVGRFVNIGMFRSSWSQPTLHVLLRLPMPIGFIYGAKDDIMPVHQGLVVSESTASSLPVCLVREAGHSPQGTHPEQFVAAFLYAYNAAAIISPEAAAEIHKRLPDTALMQYFSTYSVADTEAMLSEQYAVLRSVLRGSETVAGTTFEVLDGRVTAAAQANLVSLRL